MGRAIRALGLLAILTLVGGGTLPTVSPVSAQDDQIEVIARGLTTPGGFSWNENDVLFIALAGSGGDEPVLPESPPPAGPLSAGTTGAVAYIDDGCPTAIATGIDSTRTALGRIYGAESIAELDGQLYLLLSNAGDQYGAHDLSEGVYRVGGDGSLEQVADHAAWLQENPPAVDPPAGFPNPGNPVAMISGNGALWIADELNGLVTRVTPDGDETLVADLSAQGFAPSDLALASDGTLFAVSSGPTPYEPGSASVVQISPEGDVETVWTGLTMANGIALGNDGALYATELASGVSDAAPNGLPDSGRLVRQGDGGAVEVIADGLAFPSALATGPDGAVYFASGAVGSGNGSGWIGRYAPDGSSAEEVAPAECAPIAETLSAGSPAPVTTPEQESEPVATETPSAPPTPQPTPTPKGPWTPDSAAPTGDVIEVGLTEYTIDMPTELRAGPVTFEVTNYGALNHSLAIEGPGVDVSLARELEPGQTGAFTVYLAPGTYAVTSPTPGDRDNGMSLVLTVS